MWFDGFIWKLYEVSTWVLRIMYVNLLWLLFSLAGLIIFGFFPATASMFVVTRKWILREKEIPIFKTFWEHYRSCVVQTNILGYSLILVGTFLYIDLRFSQTSQQFIFQAFSYLFIFLFLVYFIVVLYIFPVYVHYKFKTFEYIKYAFIISVGRPFRSIMLLTGLIITFLIMRISPILVIFLCGGLMSVVMMWIAMKSFPTET